MVLIRNGSTNGDLIIRNDYQDMWRFKNRDAPSTPFPRNNRKTKKQLEKLRRRLKTPQRYTDYMKSDSWTNRRKRYWKTHKKVCSICNTSYRIELHHLVYGERGNEKDKHLVAVCRNHHLDFHEKYGSSGNMTKDWQEYLISLKE